MSDDRIDNRMREMEIKQERMLTMLENIVERNKNADEVFDRHIQGEEPYHKSIQEVVTKMKTFSIVAGFIFIVAQIVVGSYFTMIQEDIKANYVRGEANNDSIIEHVATDAQATAFIVNRLDRIDKNVEKLSNKD